MADTNETITWTFTGSADDLKRTINAIEGKLDDLGDEGVKLKRKLKGMNDETEESISKWERAKAGGRAFGGVLGEAGERIDNFKVALGKVNPAILATGAALIGVAVAVGVLVVGSKIVKWAEESSKDLEKLGLVSKGTAARLESTGDSVDVMAKSLQVVGVLIADFISPLIDKMAKGLSVLTLTITNLFQGGGVDSLRLAMEQTAEAFSKIDEVTDGFDPFASAKDSLKDFSLVEGAALKLFQANEALTAEIARGFDEQDSRVGDLRKLRDEELAFMERRLELLAATGASQAELEAGETAIQIRRVQFAIEEEKIMDDRASTRKADNASNVQEAFALTGTLLAIAKDAAKRNVAVTKGLALGEVAINTALGLSAAWKDAEPISAALRSAAVLANAGAQVAAILASNESGGPQGRTATSGFQSATPTGGGGIGGPSGDLGGGGTFIVLGNQVFDAQTRNALRRDSELDRAIRRRGNAQTRLGAAGDA